MVTALLALALIAGLLGTGAELVLLGHYETPAQYAPLVLIAAGVAAFAWQRLAPTGRAPRTLQGVMVLFILAGVAGIALHAQGNVEFELEMYPSRAGADLVWKTLTGATPVLAPGSMTLLGLIGLAYTQAEKRERPQ